MRNKLHRAINSQTGAKLLETSIVTRVVRPSKANLGDCIVTIGNSGADYDAYTDLMSRRARSACVPTPHPFPVATPCRNASLSRYNLSHNQFVRDNAVNFIIAREDGAVTAGMSVIFCSTNRNNLGGCAFVETICSHDTGGGRVLIMALKQYMRKKRHASYICAQAASTKGATQFWRKHACPGKVASCLLFMLHALHPSYVLYSDVDHVSIS